MEKGYSEFQTLEKTMRNYSSTFPKNSWQLTECKEKEAVKCHTRLHLGERKNPLNFKPWKRQRETTPLSFPGSCQFQDIKEKGN